MSKPRFYLAAPYSSTDEKVIEDRMQRFGKVASDLINQGMIIQSPLTNHLLIQQGHKIAGDWGFWRNYSTEVLKSCTVLLVLMLDGYENSPGVTREIIEAERRNIPVVYITEEDTLATIFKKWMETF